MDASERILSRKRDVFYDPQGHAIQLCVAHELDPEQMSIQSTNVFMGYSLCDDCLKKVVEKIDLLYSSVSTMPVVDMLNGLILKGKLI